MKDSCKTIGHHFLEHLYGELDEFTERRLTRHLEDCMSCREEMAEWRATLDLIDRSTMEPDEELSEQFSPIVMAIVRRRMADRRRPSLATAIAACAAFLLFAQVQSGETKGLGNVEALRETPPIVQQAREMEDPLLEEVVLKTRFIQFG